MQKSKFMARCMACQKRGAKKNHSLFIQSGSASSHGTERAPREILEWKMQVKIMKNKVINGASDKMDINQLLKREGSDLAGNFKS